jgi:hypothetical protein
VLLKPEAARRHPEGAAAQTLERARAVAATEGSCVQKREAEPVHRSRLAASHARSFGRAQPFAYVQVRRGRSLRMTNSGAGLATPSEAESEGAPGGATPVQRRMGRPKDLLRASRKAASVQGIWFPVPRPGSFGRRHGFVRGQGPVRRLPQEVSAGSFPRFGIRRGNTTGRGSLPGPPRSLRSMWRRRRISAPWVGLPRPCRPGAGLAGPYKSGAGAVSGVSGCAAGECRR